MRALSKDTKNKDSGAPSYFVVDEYHAHPTSEIYEIGVDSFGKRPQSLLDGITTAGDDAQQQTLLYGRDLCQANLGWGPSG